MGKDTFFFHQECLPFVATTCIISSPMARILFEACTDSILSALLLVASSGAEIYFQLNVNFAEIYFQLNVNLAVF